MMKRVLMLIMFVVSLVAMSVTCYAKITVEDLNIGGIYYGQMEEDVVRNLGQSVGKVPIPPHGKGDIFKRNGSEVCIAFGWKNQTERYAYRIHVKHGNEFVTASGIGIGSTYNDVIKTYGQGDVDTILNQSNSQQKFVRYDVPNIKPGLGASLFFVIDSDKKVEEILITEYEYEG